MRNAWICLLLATTFLFSCKRKDAFNFSEALVAIEHKLGVEIEKVQPEVVRLISEQNDDSLISLSTKMEGMVDKSVTELKALPVPKVPEADAFQQEAISYFGSIRELYTSYKNYAQSSDSTRMEAAEAIQALEDNLQSVVNKMQSAQQKFAKANGFRIE